MLRYFEEALFYSYNISLSIIVSIRESNIKIQVHIELNKLFFVCFLAFDCPHGWDEYDNSCYKVMTGFRYTQKLSWKNARAVCLGFGGDLVSIKNEEEIKFLSSEYDFLWIGLNDRSKEGQYVWSDGSPFNSSVFNNWNDGEPNNQGNEDCVEIKSGKWNDESCSLGRFYICEKSKGELMLRWLKLNFAREEVAIPTDLARSKMLLQLLCDCIVIIT